MKSSTRLDSVVFQLTPTRTRCDLLVTANGKTEKIATGLLNPFLAHLKTAQDQVSKGGYSIILKPEDSVNAVWFTKGTIERFVRFVSNPDVLERVYTLETEIKQIKEAIGIQNNSEFALPVVEDDLRAKRAENTEGSRPLLQLGEEKAIVLYEPGSHPKQANGSTAADENSRVQVLKVMETRKTMLQKEQGMAFARAVAAGFEVDDMLPLLSFAKSFGASRLSDACLKFMDLWKKKHETGQWVEIEAAEVMASQANISAANDSGIVFANAANMHMKSPPDSKANVNQVQGQHPQQPMYAPWPVHSPPGTFPVFQGYGMQGMPYYPNYPYPSPYPSTDDSRRSSGQRKAKKHHSSSCSEDSGSEDEDREKGKSGRRRKSGKVVIRNINYINSKKQDHSGTESDAEKGAIVEYDNGKEERETKRTEADTGDWQAFQTFLLQDADREERTATDHMMEKEVAGKKRLGAGRYDPLAYDEREAQKYQERDRADIQNGVVARKFRGSSDSFMVSQRENGFENSSDPLNLNGFDHPRNGLDKKSPVNMDDDSYVVTREAGSNMRNAIDIGSEISSYHQTDGNERKQINYEPHDLSLMPERETEKLSAGYDPALDFGSRDLKKSSQQAAGVAKKSVRDPKSRRLSNDAADKKKASGPIRKGRPTKMSPLDEARARADKLRNFKADLLIMKKEKEEEERKRIEALKIARQKRIASKSNSTGGGQSQLPAQQARKKLVNKFSPGAPRTSKFSDSVPGSVSPLQRLPIRSASLGSNESQKLPTSGKLSTTGSKSTVNRLTRSISPLPPSKRETIATVNRVTRSTSPLPLSKRETRVSLDSQNKSVSRIRRLSEPKIGNSSASSSSVRSLRTVAKATDTPEIKKISAIVNYDIAKIASLPELKIKPQKGPTNVLVKGVEKTKSSASEIEPSGSKNESLGQNDVNETPVIEKTVVMVLPNSARSISADQTKREKPEVVPETTPESGNDLVLVRLETLSDLVTETPKFLTSQSVAVKPYEAPYARVSSLEDSSCTAYSEYSQAPAPSVHSNKAVLETGKVLVPEKKISEALEKSQTKESASKGLRNLLKFGKKSQSSSTSECHTESDNAAGNSNKDHGSAVTAATTSEAFTLKNLISQDETPTAAAASQKSSRHFSILSPFKNKKTVS
ncbi:COP1-interacting protein-like protein [Hirschfeldia incana]|nr:COP1-interacting protein-like protein [Hirschfeldia incana]